MINENEKNSILIVEDEVSLRNALSIKFKREKFNTFSAKDGEVGLFVALKEKPDLILLDMVMPKMDGMTMLKKLRLENEWGKSVPVILLTNLGADDEQRMKEISKDPMLQYLVKSNWSIGDLVEKVRTTISRV
jgi:DNA-binding response OmpR family regulator